jgi:hypothetical protein
VVASAFVAVLKVVSVLAQRAPMAHPNDAAPAADSMRPGMQFDIDS